MVLESIIKPERAEKSPFRMLIIGFFYSTLGLFLAGWVFGSYASISAIFLTSLPLIVIMVKLMKLEESKDLVINGEIELLREHEKALRLFIFLFIGMVLSYSLWFTILPQETGENLFSFQIEILKQVTGSNIGYGATTQFQGSVSTDFDKTYTIIFNNLRVLSFCIIFSFIYGAGAIFILTLNASVVGVAAGNILRQGIESFAGFTNIDYLYNYFESFPFPYCFLIHGIPEIGGYFVGALAGGIISFAVINHDFRSREFSKIIIDSLDLIILAVIIIVISGFIEIYATPCACDLSQCLFH